MSAQKLAGLPSGTVVYGGSRQPRTLFRMHGTGRHWIGEHGERYTDAEAAEELGEFESDPPAPTREQIAEAIHGGLADRGFDFEDEDTTHLATRVAALIQNGADR